MVDNYPDRELPKYCIESEDGYWSTLYVDEEGVLQFVDKDYHKPPVSISLAFTDSWNGKPQYPNDENCKRLRHE